MKIALSSYSLRSHVNSEIPYWEFPAYARETFGIDALEIVQFQVLRGDSAAIDRLKDGLTAAGATLVSMPLDVGDISQADATKRERDLRLIEYWIESAAYLGCPVTRVNSRDGDIRIAAASYQRLVDVGHRLGVTIAMENHGGLSARRDAANQLLQLVPGLATSPDFGNFKEEERYDFLADMAPRATIVHAKTLDFAPDGSMPAFDVARCVRIMRDAGFSGYYSIEFEGQGDQIDGVKRSLALLRAIGDDLGI